MKQISLVCQDLARLCLPHQVVQPSALGHVHKVQITSELFDSPQTQIRIKSLVLDVFDTVPHECHSFETSATAPRSAWKKQESRARGIKSAPGCTPHTWPPSSQPSLSLLSTTSLLIILQKIPCINTLLIILQKIIILNIITHSNG